jgi:hypothetical protein
MYKHSSFRILSTVASLAAAASLATCGSETPTAAPGPAQLDREAAPVGTVALCRRSPGAPTIVEVAGPAVPAFLARGDYVSTLLVSHDGSGVGDGVHFRRIGDALDAARAGRLARGELLSAACRITIMVSGDTYYGTATGGATGDTEQFPFLVDVPDITLRGAMEMGLNDEGRATGVSTNGAETRLVPVEPMPVIDGASTPIIVADGHPDGSAGNGLVIRGLVFESGHLPIVEAGGQGVLALRVTGLQIQGNRFEGGFTESIDLRATDAGVVENHLSGTGGTCDICFAAPGHYRASGNLLLAGGIPGITIDGAVNLPTPTGVEPLPRYSTAELWADVRNNEVRDHQRIPVGVGIRVDALGVNGSDTHNTVHAVIQDNQLVNNRFGMIVHGAFPTAGADNTSNLDVTLGGNAIEQSCEARLLISFSRHQTTLGIKAFPYLVNSTFALKLNGNVDWNDVWYGHPAGYGNTLVVNGQVIPNGTQQSYSATGCPGL